MFSNNVKKLLQGKEENEQKGNNKRKIENLVFLIVLVIITIVIINLILNSGKDESSTGENTTSKTKQLASSLGINNGQNKTVETSSSTDDLKTRLEEILKKIQGVKDVNVFINYSESSETVAMFNENSKTTQTEEADTSGGTRKIEENDTQKEVIYQENNGEKIPITQKIVSPKIEGAIITAKGANDANVKTNIIQAVEAATGLPTHKIQVFEMN